MQTESKQTFHFQLHTSSKTKSRQFSSPSHKVLRWTCSPCELTASLDNGNDSFLVHPGTRVSRCGVFAWGLTLKKARLSWSSHYERCPMDGWSPFFFTRLAWKAFWFFFFSPARVIILASLKCMVRFSFHAEWAVPSPLSKIPLPLP